MCVCDVFKNYTIRLLMISHDTINDGSKSDGCLLMAIGVAIGAAVVLTLVAIVVTAACLCCRRPTPTHIRVRLCLPHFLLLNVTVRG